MASTFSITGSTCVRGIASRKVIVDFLYDVGSTAYSVAQANQGVLFPVFITKVDFIRNIRNFGFLVFYNSQYYEDQLTDEITARNLAIAYWESQEDTILRQLCCGCDQITQGPWL
jgi:hypothetical protein